MADEQAPETPAKAPRVKAAKPELEAKDDAGINASITGDLNGPRKPLDVDDDDPGINANVVS